MFIFGFKLAFECFLSEANFSNKKGLNSEITNNRADIDSSGS
jgi:hypothetical protein